MNACQTKNVTIILIFLHIVLNNIIYCIFHIKEKVFFMVGYYIVHTLNGYRDLKINNNKYVCYVDEISVFCLQLEEFVFFFVADLNKKTLFTFQSFVRSIYKVTVH